MLPTVFISDRELSVTLPELTDPEPHGARANLRDEQWPELASRLVVK